MGPAYSLIHPSIGKRTKKALRFIYNAYDWETSLSSLHASSALPRLSCRRKVKRLKFLYNLIHNRIGLNFNDYLKYNDSRATRRKHENFLREFQCKKYILKYDFFPRTVRDWNSLPQCVTSLDTYDCFSRALEDILYISN